MENLDPVPQVMKKTMYINNMYILIQAVNIFNTSTMETLSTGLN